MGGKLSVCALLEGNVIKIAEIIRYETQLCGKSSAEEVVERINKPKRVSLWPRLSVMNTRVGQLLELGICSIAHLRRRINAGH